MIENQKCTTCGEIGTMEFAPEWDVEGYLYYRCSCCGKMMAKKINPMREFQEREMDDLIEYLTRYRGE